MWVNNEVGAVQPVAAIAERCCAAGVAFHTDAVQAFGKVAIRLAEVACTLATISGHKIGAPKGIGALIVRDRKAIEAIIHGGGQQFGIRPGTENVAGAVALGRAAALAAAEQPAESARLRALRDELTVRLRAGVPDLVVNAEGAERAPHLLSVAVPGTDSEALLMHLDLAGVAASSGSACSTGAVEPSHVLVAMGLPRELALGAIRLSLGHASSADDVARVAEVMPAVVAKVRKLAGVLGRA
jgi:cysteine desulfurase